MFHALCLKYMLTCGLFLILAKNACLPTYSAVPAGKNIEHLPVYWGFQMMVKGPSLELGLLRLQTEWFRINYC